ncbi:MAG: hypothetical protein ACQETO_08200 [Pseudomonadota bacterium]
MNTDSENRKQTGTSDIDPELMDEALQQLEEEIGLLEEWINDLKGRAENDEAARQAAITYRDKIRSRREMRDALLINRDRRKRKSR